MKKLFASLLLLFTCTIFAAVNVIPQPVKVEELSGSLALSKKVLVNASRKVSPSLKRVAADIFKSNVKSTLGMPVKIKIDIAGKGEAEGYKLTVNKNAIIIVASDNAGAFYALQTVKQLALFSKDGKIPCVKIEDAPRYGWRGFMLDESRHFFGKEKVKELLDFMAMYKLNRFHWHLTDSDGWRIEIKKYPKLSTVGAKGNYTDKKAPAAFYTQAEIKEIVKYAMERHIEIIPEIDMPGHATAAARAYPEVSGGGNAKNPDFTFNPGSEKTYKFLTNVIAEIAELFPAKWIHYGGDEVHFANKQWINIPEVKQLMAKENLKDLTDVEHYFNIRMAKVIERFGKGTAAWDEVVNAGLDKGKSLVFWWRHDKRNVLKAAFDKGFNVVLCPRIPCYFDFVQDNSHKVGRRWGGFSSLDRLYKFPAGLNVAEAQVIGIQANLWTEKVKTDERFDFMIYPRLQALAESAWTEGENKNYDRFLEHLKVQLPYMKKKGIYYFNPFDKSEHPEPKK